MTKHILIHRRQWKVKLCPCIVSSHIITIGINLRSNARSSGLLMLGGNKLMKGDLRSSIISKKATWQTDCFGPSIWRTSFGSPLKTPPT